MSRDIQPQCLIGVDVGGTKTLALLVELAPGLPPRVVDRELVPSEAGSDESIEQIERAVEAILDRATTRPSAIGVGLAGFVDRHGIVRSAPNSAGLIGIDVAARLEERFGVPAVVDNDANCVAVATHALAEPDAQSLVAITLGTGIGGGIVRDLLVRDIPVVLRGDLYAVAALAGATVVVAGHLLQWPPMPTAVAGAVVCFVMRFIALRHGWSLPVADADGRPVAPRE